MMRYTIVVILLIVMGIVINISECQEWKKKVTHKTGLKCSTCYLESIAISPDKTFYVVVGEFLNGATFEGQTLTSNGNVDILVAKYSMEDNTLIWKKTYGGTIADRGYAVTIGSDSSIYVGGTFLKTVTFGSLSPITYSFTFDPEGGNGSDDIFLLKLDSTGVEQWVKSYGSNGIDTISFLLADDKSDSVYMAGSFQTTITFGTITLNGVGDVYISKIKSNGDDVLWSITYGIAGLSSIVSNIGRDPDGNLYTAGYLPAGKTLTVDGKSITSDANDGSDVYVLKLSGDNGKAIWLKKATSTKGSLFSVRNVVAGSDGSLYITGVFSGTVNIGTLSKTSGSVNPKVDMYVVNV
jgi:hypothetical protein